MRTKVTQALRDAARDYETKESARELMDHVQTQVYTNLCHQKHFDNYHVVIYKSKSIANIIMGSHDWTFKRTQRCSSGPSSEIILYGKYKTSVLSVLASCK